MKKKNMGGGVLSTQPDQQKKGPMQKCAKNAKKKYQTLKIFSSLVSLTRNFTKFIFLEQLAAMPQFNMQNMFFFSFFLAVIMIRTFYFICIIFVKKNIIIYWLIFTVNHQASYFPFFLSSFSGSNIFIPQQIL